MNTDEKILIDWIENEPINKTIKYCKYINYIFVFIIGFILGLLVLYGLYQ